MLPRSYTKFNYALRPSKQVERKLFVEALVRLGTVGGYDIPDYAYLGFGSVYYADFHVFNRYLYIDDMICVEGGPDKERMKFNRPLGSIKLKLDMLKNVIPDLDRSRRYFAWPDFDAPLTVEVLRDIRSLVSVLHAGSVLVFTVEAEPRDEFRDPLDKRTRSEIVADRVEAINRSIGDYMPSHFRTADYHRLGLPRAYALAINNAIVDQTTRRRDVAYLQLFNYRYSDGAQMLSVGGIIDTDEALASLEASPFMKWRHLNRGLEPVEISVPPLTPLERQFLDKWVTDPDPDGPLPFELDDPHLRGFERYRRYYPQYFETLT